ncbi:MAG: hypothetical protein CMJ18_08095 [Phycisphaeraceae bacterium]|nr:hypothetical protein [Phycisphaeraceae bacterium]
MRCAQALCLAAALLSGARAAPMPAGIDPHAVYNGSFEIELPGMRPLVPHGWIVSRSTGQDHMSLVDDPAVAHWGNRCVRIASAGDSGIALHSFAHAVAFPVRLTPGSAYTVRVWARRAAGTPATLSVEPGGGKWALTDAWRRYECRHDHPADAPEAMGATIRIRGGPALVDDVSITPAGAAPIMAPELKADRSTLAALPVDRAWSAAADGSGWSHRTAVRISAVTKAPAEHSRIRLQLRSIRPGLRYDDLAPDRIHIVDTSDPKAPVPFAFVETAMRKLRSAQTTGWDELVFLARCPPRSSKVYQVYFEDDSVAGSKVRAEAFWPDAPPGDWPPAANDQRLDCRVDAPEPRAAAASVVRDGRLHALAVLHAQANSTARVISPTGDRRIEVPLVRSAAHDLRQVPAPSWRMPSGSEPGVWRFEVRFTEASGRKTDVHSTFVWGSALWHASNLQRIHRDDPPRYGATAANLAAARNERESCQIVVASSVPLAGVTLSATELVHEAGAARINPDRFRFDLVEEIYLDAPVAGPTGYNPGFGGYHYSGRGGWQPDPLMPWTAVDVPAEGQRVAWLTVHVPADALAGVYRGRILATAADGRSMALPLALKVFGFALPDDRPFTPVLGADTSGNRAQTMAVAEVFGRSGVTPFYYSQNRSPYPAPWRYHPQNGRAEIDFTAFDEGAALLLDKIGVRYLFIGSEYHPGGRKLRRIYDGGGGRFETVHSPVNGTVEAEAMWRAWAGAMGAHLREKGWLDRAYVYVTDEPSIDELLPVVERIARIIKQEHGIRGFVACGGSKGDAIGPRKDYLDWIDAYSGRSDEQNRQWMRERGPTNWGVYNRPWFIGLPLAQQRVIPADSWLEGIDAYFHWSMSNLNSKRWRVEPRRLKFRGKVAGCPAGSFIRYYEIPGAGNAVYWWPDDEPLPAGRARAAVSSIRLESLREGLDDHAYLARLGAIADRAGAGSAAAASLAEVRRDLSALLTASRFNAAYPHDLRDWNFFVLDTAEWETLRRRAAGLIERFEEPAS